VYNKTERISVTKGGQVDIRCYAKARTW